MQFFRRMFATALGVLAFLAGSVSLTSASTSTDPIAEGNFVSQQILGGPYSSAEASYYVGKVLKAPAPPVNLELKSKPEYQWYSCDAKPNLLASSLESCQEFSSGAEVVISQNEVGKFVAYSMAFGDDPKIFGLATPAAVSPAPSLNISSLGPNKSLRFSSAKTPALNSKLTVVRGSWPAIPGAYTFAYSWLRCTTIIEASETAPEGCSVIDGARSASYTVTAKDAGFRLVASVVASLDGTDTSIWTNSSGIVYTNISYFKGAGVAAGDGSYPAVVGIPVKPNPGTWAGPPSFKYQWYVCSSKVAGSATLSKLCKIIPGATRESFTPTLAQNGKYLMVRLSGSTPLAATVVTTFSAGSVKVLDDPSNAKAVSVPNQAPVVGDKITATSGTWSGTPAPTRTYQWYACETADLAAGDEKPEDCEEVPGATSSSITVSQNLFDKFLVVEERASNTAGSSSIFSASTLAVVSRPVFESDPVVLGTPEVGQTFAAVSGVGESSLEDSISYQWHSCATASASAITRPANCLPISGATNSEFMATRVVEGLYLSVSVTLTNKVGSTVRFSATSNGFVNSSPELETSTLTSVPDPLVGTALSAPSGLWRGAPAPQFSYQWLVCTAPGLVSQSVPDSCRSIVAANSATYTPTKEESGFYLRVQITATNANGDFSVVSAASPVVREKPNFISIPVLSGAAINGSTIELTETASNGVPVPVRTISWYQCKTQVLSSTSAVPANAGCVQIVGQSGPSYVASNADLDRFVGALVTSTNSVGSTSVFTATTSVIRGEPKLVGSISAPGISGTSPRVGSPVNAPNSTWIGSPTPTKLLQWFSCAEQIAGSDQLSASCSTIQGAAGPSYTPTVEDVDRYLMVRIIASNSLGDVYQYSPTSLIVQEAPNFLVDPEISTGRLSGDLLVFGELFTRGSPAPQITYSWHRCDSAIGTVQNSTTCQKIAGATGASYRLTAADLDKFVSGSVTLTSAIGSVTRVTVSTVKIQGAPALVGQLAPPSAAAVRADVPIVMANTVWTGSPAVSRAIQWFSCPTAIPNASESIDPLCESIQGAVSSSFTPTSAQVGRFLAIRIVASNAIGTVTMFSPTTSVVNEIPSFQGDPIVDDVNLVGNKVSLSLPVVRGFPAPSVTQSWYRCSASVGLPSGTLPAGCALIPNQSQLQYTLDTPDLDRFVLAAVTLTNSSGAITRFTPSTVKVQGVPKLTNTLGLPSSSIVGVTSPRIGTLHNAPTNTWAGSPNPTVAFQWVRCEDIDSEPSTVPVPCEDIPGATAKTYTPTNADKTFALRVRITATNSLGTTTIWSGSTQRTQQPPSFAADPTLNEFISVGQLLRVNAVSQIAYPIATESYLWYRCTSVVVAPTNAATPPAGCTQILNESISTHTILSADVDSYLLAKVTLTNQAGTVFRYTASTAKIITPPVFEQEPTVVGQAYVTGSLAINTFNVTAKPPATLTYQWYNCESRTFASVASVPAGCDVISGATSATYSPAENLAGRYVSVLVTARNAAGQVSSFSKTTTAIMVPPKNVIAPLISGSTVVGGTLTTDSGTWIPGTGVNFEYKWYACSKPTTASDTISLTDCPLVAGASASSLNLGEGQVGKYMVAGVTAKNFTINVTKFSASSEVIANTPVYVSGMNVTLPTGEGSTSGAPRVGYKIAAVEGIWTGTPAPTFAYQWFVCGTQKTRADETLTNDCRNIIGASGREFAISKEIAQDYDLIGQFLGVRITGSNKAGSDFAYSVTAAKTVTMPPQLVTAPSISGYRYVDGTLKGSVGVFNGTPATRETQAWWQCDTAISEAVSVKPASCTSITGATAATLKLTLAMKGKFVTAATTSTNDAGSLTIWAASTVAVTTGAINTVPPTVVSDPVGIPKVGGTLTANQGTWSGDPALTEDSYTYQWYSCEAEIKSASFDLDLTAGCIRVGDAVNKTFQPIGEDAGRYALVSVTGTNSQGGSTIFSATTTRINAAPQNMVLPLLSGTAFVGTPQDASEGTWTGVPDPTFTYQWLLCDSEQTVAPAEIPADCALIAGATSPNYTPLISQVGKFLMAQVTAKNIAGSATVLSLTTPEIKSAPVNLVAPNVLISNDTSSLPVANQSTLSTAGGTWQGRPTPTFEYQWFSCAAPLTSSAEEPAPEKDCKAVSPRAANLTYDPVASDRGRFVAVKVYATNVHATVTHWSATTSVINMAPVADIAPVVTGTAFAQSTVIAKSDTWTSFPEPVRTFQWLSCGEIEVPSSCSVIGGASSETYTIPSTLVGKSIMVRVTATNAFGIASNYSLASAKVTTGPVSTTSHVITGSVAYPPAAGAVLTSNDGVWAGDPRPTLTYQWYRCSAVVSTSVFGLDPKCSSIEGATSNTYRLTDEDPSSSLVVGITGVNTWGSSTRYSASTPIVTEKVRVLTLPSLLSSARIGEEITASEGVWRGFPAPTTTYAWFSCTVANPDNPVRIPASSGSAVTPPASCAKILGATRTSFSISNSHLGKMLVFMVTKTNTVDGVTTSVSAYSQSSLPAAQPPVSLAKPVISSPGVVSGSNPKVGSVWSVSSGLWADPQPIRSYQWYRCDNQVATGPADITTLPAGCVPIEGATSTSYTIAAEDSGKFINVEAVGSNAADTLRRWSNSTLSVLQVPIAVVPPTISGDRQRGMVLTADPGVWTGSPTPVITFQWYTCKSPFAATSTTPQPATNCSQISGETASTYTQSPAGGDDGKFITATVSGTSGTSDPTVYWVAVAPNDATAQAPLVQTLPTISSKSGNAAVGEVFSIEDDRWIAAPAPTFTYRWFACDLPNIPAGSVLPQGCALVPGQTSQTYTATIEFADSRKYLMGSVTATNRAGSSTAYSKSFGSIIDKGIINTKAASITVGSTVVPTSIDWTSGTWTSNSELRVTHKWLSCLTALPSVYSYIPSDCEIIESIVETDPSQPQPLIVTAASELSGQYISLYERVDQKVDTIWRKVRERVTTTTSQLLEAPSLRSSDPGFVAPSVPRDMVVGYSASATSGEWVQYLLDETSYTWRGSRVGTFNYQWFKCETSQSSYTVAGLPAGCSDIPSSAERSTTGSSIVPSELEVGSYLGVRITAINTTGSYSVWTKTSLAVTQEPTNVTAPTLGSEDTVGQRLTLSGGLVSDWKGSPTPAVSVEWYTCSVPFLTPPATAPGADKCQKFVNGSEAPNEGLTIPNDRWQGTQYLMASITATNTPRVSTNTSKSVTLFTATSKRIIAKPYINTAATNPLPALSGFADVGSQLNLSVGSWLGTQPMTASGRWYACDSVVAVASTDKNVAAGCTQFKSGPLNVLLSKEQAGKYVVGQIVYENIAGTSYQSTISTVKVLEPPTVSTPPEISLVGPVSASGNIEVGQTLSFSAGVWSGSPTPSVTGRFYACLTHVASPAPTVPADCTLIAGATGLTYTLADAQAGKHIVAVSVANNTVNSGSRTVFSVSSSFGPIYRTPYFDTALAPTITVSPNLHVGSTASFTRTTVKGFEAPTTTYSWYICEGAVSSAINNSVPAGCSKITPADNAALAIPAEAAGKRILAIQKASAAWTSEFVTRSTITTAIITASPSATTSPSVSGNDYVGAPVKLTVDKGLWTSYPTITDNSKYLIEWLLCDKASVAGVRPTPCATTPVASFTANAPIELAPTAAHAGKFLVARVTATVATNKSATDTGVSYSASIGPIRQAPTLPGQPSITGRDIPDVGKTLTMVTTTPGGFPVNTPTYDWYSCMSASATIPTSIPADCSLIEGSSNKALVIPSSAAGRYIVGWVTATNSLGSASKATAYTPIVKMAPVNTAAPTLSGGDEVGVAVTANPGVWSSSPAPTFTYQWYVCDSDTSVVSSGCVAQGQASAIATFTPTESHAGKFVLANVTATTATWSGNALAVKATSTFGPIRLPATIKSAPLVTGTAHVGETLTLAFPTNAILGFPKPSTSYDWYACDTAVTGLLATLPENCSLVNSSENKPLPLSAAHAGKFMTALVTSVNYQTVRRVVVSSVGVTATLTNDGLPVLTGDLFVGGTSLTVSSGTWSSTPAVNPSTDVSYAFFSCPTATWSSVDCSTITTANSRVSSLALTASLQGKFVIVRVTASVPVNKSGTGTVTVASNSVGPIEASPTFTATPAVSGVMHVDSTLTANISGERGFPAPEKAYAWYLCSSAITVSSATLPAGCEPVDSSIDGSATLILPKSSAGKFVSAVVTLKNTRGQVSSSTLSTLAVTATPEIVSSPVVGGDDIFATGKTVTVSTGTWFTAPANVTKTFTYSWYACPTALSQIANCGYLGDTTAGSIATSEAMVDRFIVAKVTVSVPVNKSGAGTAIAYSGPSSRIRKAAVFTATPTISGYLHVGETLTASSGNPSGVPTPSVSYSWFICPSPVASAVAVAPNSCTQSNSSTTNTFVVPATAGGAYVLVIAKASSDEDLGAVTRSSISTVAVSSSPVIGATKPAITGAAILGSTALTVSSGTWSWKPSTSTATYSYRWFACNTQDSYAGGLSLPETCSLIANQTSSSLTLNAAQLGYKILAEVTASVASNMPSPSRSSYYTPFTEIVQSKPAASTTPPTISYTTLTAGSILKATLGTWTGSPTPTLAHTWYLCPANTTQPTNRLAPTTCTAQTAKGDLTVLSSFKGLKILLLVTASNSAGTATNLSALVTIP